MRRIVLGIFAAIGIIAALTVLGTGIAVWRIASSRPALPKSIILTAELGRDLLEGPRQNEVSELLTGRKQTMRGFLDAIERAAEDSRVRGLYAHIDGDSLGLAKVQELRDAVQAFRARGKFAIAFSESFGEFGGGTRSYYLATAFDEIWLQPLGAVGLTGLRVESPFFRGTFDKLAIVPRLDHRSEYKSAMNMMTDKEMGAPQREETAAIVKSIFGQLRRDVAASRWIGETEFTAIVDGGPYQ